MKKGEIIRLTYNRKLLFLILIFLVFFSVVIYIFKFNSQKDDSNKYECIVDSDCFPEECCHPTSCGSVSQKPDCAAVLCSAVCSGPLDCNAGYCGCINNKCSIIKNE